MLGNPEAAILLLNKRQNWHLSHPAPVSGPLLIMGWATVNASRAQPICLAAWRDGNAIRPKTHALAAECGSTKQSPAIRYNNAVAALAQGK